MMLQSMEYLHVDLWTPLVQILPQSIKVTPLIQWP